MNVAITRRIRSRSRACGTLFSISEAQGLEARRLLAVSAALDPITHIWAITGDTSANTVIIDAGTSSNLTAKDGSGNLIAGQSNVQANSVIAIVVNADAGDDSITVTSNVTQNATLNGSTGNDTLAGGRGDDSLAGGTGNDTYRFSGTSSLGSDIVEEGAVADTDTLDFSGWPEAVQGNGANGGRGFDLSATTTQAAGADLTIRLTTDTGIENVVGTNVDLGSSDADKFIGNSRPNRMQGGDGSDHLLGKGGNDTLFGDAGNDCVHGEAGDDLEYGGDGDDGMGDIQHEDPTNDPDIGNDTIYGNANGDLGDLIAGGDNNDVIYGDDGAYGASLPNAAGNDTIFGNADADLVYGGGGDDQIFGGAGGDTLYGDYYSVLTYSSVHEGDDTIDGEEDGDFIYGDSRDVANGFGYGNDILYGGAGDDHVYGEAGYGTGGTRSDSGDTLYGSAGSDTLTGEDGDDTYRFATASDTENLGAETVSETSTGTGGTDTLDFDLFLFPSGNHTGVTVTLASTSGQTVVTSRLTLTLGSSSSVENVIGSTENDSITGNGLGNVLRGEAGNDTIGGGYGSDTADYSTSQFPVNISLNGINDDTDGSGTNSTDVIQSDIENVTGGFNDDTITGNASANVLRGGPGNDTIHGGAGNDALYGDAGSDSLFGDADNDSFFAMDGDVDVLDGGTGTDFAVLGTQRDSIDTVSNIENT